MKILAFSALLLMVLQARAEIKTHSPYPSDNRCPVDLRPSYADA